MYSACRQRRVGCTQRYTHHSNAMFTHRYNFAYMTHFSVYISTGLLYSVFKHTPPLPPPLEAIHIIPCQNNEQTHVQRAPLHTQPPLLSSGPTWWWLASPIPIAKYYRATREKKVKALPSPLVRASRHSTHVHRWRAVIVFVLFRHIFRGCKYPYMHGRYTGARQPCVMLCGVLCERSASAYSAKCGAIGDVWPALSVCWPFNVCKNQPPTGNKNPSRA